MIDKLAGVHPKLKRIYLSVQAEMEKAGHPIIVTDGVRTAEEQHAAWRKGRDEHGRVIDRSKVVTDLDGYLKKSLHQLQADGTGHAIDCAFLVNGKPSWDESHPWPLYGSWAKSFGAKWGGDFTRLVKGERVPHPDRPHIEIRV